MFHALLLFCRQKILSRCLQFYLFVLCIGAIAACQPFLGSKGGKQEIAQVKNPCIILALPASGPYANVAAKIKQGAEIARASLKKNGIDVDLRNINTEAPDWLAKLSALPPMCAVVGGPLRDKKYMEARKAGVIGQRVFFSFLPTLAQGDEGKLAWRFFPSQQDQIDAIVNFATDQMNIRTYGSFYPADNYGRRMSDMLEKNLAKRNIPLQKASYNPSSSATWSASAKTLINPRMGEDGKTIVPGTNFEALFLPDSWKHMDMLTASLRANGEDRLVLLGSTLWEHGLSGRQAIKPDRYALAVFPVAWNRANVPAALKKGNYNFWTALGFDFISFAGHIGLAERPDAGAVQKIAQKSSPLLKAMAPMRWDSSGIGHQRMFLYQPTPAGLTPLNIERFRQARTAVAEKAALRMQGWGHIDPVTGEALAEPDPEPVLDEQAQAADGETSRVQPVPSGSAADEPQTAREYSPAAPQQAARQQNEPSANQGVMSSTPRPSYKLSLPVRQ